jgi:hypothetical protein
MFTVNGGRSKGLEKMATLGTVKFVFFGYYLFVWPNKIIEMGGSMLNF